MKRKIIIIAGIVLVLGVGYFIYRRKTALSSPADSQEAQVFTQMKALIAERIPGGVPHWIADDMLKLYNKGAGATNEYYLAMGRLTKPGALLATMDAEYLPEKYNYEFKGGKAQGAGKADRDALANDLHAIWQQYRATVDLTF